MAARIITVANLKGGVGKSNIAVNLACELGGGERRVALVDADPQGTSSHWMSRGRYPAQIHSFPLEDERGAQSWITKVLSIDSDFLLIDCPAHSRAVTEIALSLSRLAVIPLTASGPDLIATTNVLNLIETSRAMRDGNELSFLLVPSKIDHRTGAGRRIGDVLRHLGDVVGPEVRQRTAFVDAFTERKWIGEFAPKSDARHDIVNLANAVLAKMEEIEGFGPDEQTAQVS
ncbi:ParA family protein [Pelagibius sp. Alg239-R121]|uniref:ParA family protein n=1 Tax=Pelagibius sp. Alg239-R121 TaxID=2993448 RepID=UPI0024A6EDB7|nr:ParA family protein [Pelagibius sp. Alg239-R121]